MRIGISGHQKMPPEVVEYVKRDLAETLATVPALVGVSSLAVGADQLFAEAVLAAGGRLEVLIPCQRYETTFDHSQAQERYEMLLRLASQVSTLDFPGPSETAFFAAGQSLASNVDELIAVWDGKPSKGLGGTADVVAFARSIGTPVVVVWPAGATR